MPQSFSYRSRISASATRVFSWHARPGAFDRLNPPWQSVRVVERSGGIRDGARVTVDLPIGPLMRRMTVEHEKFSEGQQFEDRQVSGPFASWHHHHQFSPDDNGGCLLEDAITYELPGGSIGNYLGKFIAHDKLMRIFSYRHRVTASDIARCQTSSLKPQKILMTGCTGLIGSQLAAFLSTAGHDITGLSRYLNPSAFYPTLPWDPERNSISQREFCEFDTVVHLAGENIAARRWSASQKRRIRDSRVASTAFLAQALIAARCLPRTFIVASATGFYGDRGDQFLDENSKPGEGFLPEVCLAWEAAARPLQERGVRVVHARFGTVLTPQGGALAKMLPPFLCALGGTLGSGQQYMPWISIDDLLYALLFLLERNEFSGPVNISAPEPVTNREFTRTLAEVLKRPALVPVPASVLRVIFGEMAEAALLASTRAVPARLMYYGHRFEYPNLRDALRHVLGRM